ncbi:MAG: hypothetical protein ABJQ23_06840 [Shimia thalassica]|uniref:hypothetical protein n=1 Tax=Shimia thalassica TaxID=1715693 RepID=UPI0032992CA5
MLRRFRKDPLKYALDLASLSILINIVLGFFVILTWNSYGRIPDDNHISVGLTTIEIFLIVVAFSGFWMLRSLVVEAAVQVTEEAVENEFDEYKPELRRTVGNLVKAELAELKIGTQANSCSGEQTDGYDIASAMGDENGGNNETE